MRLPKSVALTFMVLLFQFLSACNGSRPELKNLMKSDIDMVADAHLDQVESLFKELTVKLYRRNPRELHKGQINTLNGRFEQLFAAKRCLDIAEIDHKQGIPAILMALDLEYTGDRVFPLLVGLTSMIRNSYDNHTEFFLIDSLDPQKLYNSARNIEILVWRLKSRRDAAGKPLLLTNSLPEEERNLSFERLFGKLIAHQDMIAQIASDKWDRAINRVVHSAAKSVFLPVGF